LDANRRLVRIKWITHVCTVAWGQVAVIASGSPASPSQQQINTSVTPRLRNSARPPAQNRAPSPASLGRSRARGCACSRPDRRRRPGRPADPEAPRTSTAPASVSTRLVAAPSRLFPDPRRPDRPSHSRDARLLSIQRPVEHSLGQLGEQPIRTQQLGLISISPVQQLLGQPVHILRLVDVRVPGRVAAHGQRAREGCVGATGGRSGGAGRACGLKLD
jgi:hypothetical protein